MEPRSSRVFIRRGVQIGNYGGAGHVVHLVGQVVLIFVGVVHAVEPDRHAGDGAVLEDAVVPRDRLLRRVEQRDDVGVEVGNGHLRGGRGDAVRVSEQALYLQHRRGAVVEVLVNGEVVRGDQLLVADVDEHGGHLVVCETDVQGGVGGQV